MRIPSYAGNLFYPAAAAGSVLRRWRDWLATLPQAFTSSVVLMNFPPFESLPDHLRGRSFAIVRGAWPNASEVGDELMSYWREWRTPEVDTFGSLPFARVAEISNDPTDPVPAGGTGLWMRALSDDTIDELIETTFDEGGRPLLIFSEVRHTAAPVADGESLTAVNERGALLLLEMLGVTPTPEVRTAVRGAITEAARRIGRDLTGQHYLNFVEGEQRRGGVELAFGVDARSRLAAVKSRLDPDGLFDHGLDALT